VHESYLNVVAYGTVTVSVSVSWVCAAFIPGIRHVAFIHFTAVL